MECFNPISVPKWHDGKKSRVEYQKVPCGKCLACLSARQNDWIFRLQQENRLAKQSYFITLTYTDENVPQTKDGLLTLRKKDVQLYFKRVRKAIPTHWEFDRRKGYNVKVPNYHVRYLACGEYGKTTHRPHYHAIIFCDSDSADFQQILVKCWNFGFTTIGTVCDASIAYTTKYCLKEGYIQENCEPTFSLMSTKPALGSAYVQNDQNFEYHMDHPFLTLPGGRKQRLPRYYNRTLNVHNTAKFKTLEDVYIEAHPEDVRVNVLGVKEPGSGFESWKQQRIKQYIENKLKRSKANSLL